MKRLSFLPRAAMMLLVMLLTGETVWAWDGSGTADDPYLIGTLKEFKEFREQSLTNSFEGVYFRLIDDIYFDDSQTNNFNPVIASDGVAFQGVFDGDNNAISGIRIDKSNLDYIKPDDSSKEGIFCEIGTNGVVRNLIVENTRMHAYSMSGIIASYCVGTIENCYIANDVELYAMYPSGSLYGSVAGLVRGGHIDNCISEASVTLSDRNGNYYSMGGLVGELQGGSITNCLFTGSLQLSSLSISHNNFAVLGCLNYGTITNNYYTDSSLKGAYEGISLAHTVTSHGDLWAYGERGEGPSDMKGISFRNKLYLEAGEPFYVSVYSPYGNYFNISKDDDDSVVAGNVKDSYLMPAYDITLTMGRPLFAGENFSPCVPVDIPALFMSWSKSQFVIPAAALEDMVGQNVTSVTFYTAPLYELVTTPFPVDVYLKEVDKASINSFVDKGSATMAYQGSLSIKKDDYGMFDLLTIEFDTPYLYQGGNLLVGIDNIYDFSPSGDDLVVIGPRLVRKKVSGGLVIDSDPDEEGLYFFGQQVPGASVYGSDSDDPDNIVAMQQNFIPMTTFTYSASVFSAPRNIMADNITTSSAELSWKGNSDAYHISYRKLGQVEYSCKETFDSGMPEGWETQLGLLSSIMSGGNFHTWNRWSFDSRDYPFIERVTRFNGFDAHILTNNSYNDHNDWLITSDYTIGEGVGLCFDLALADYFGELDTSGFDDRFVVLLTTDNMASWTILREWNNSGSEYVYNKISQKGQNISIDLSSYAGQTVRFAFYAESTVRNSDNYIHIDNVGIGHMVEGSDWQTVTTNQPSITLTGLTPGASYEVKVQSDYGTEGLTAWTDVFTFTTSKPMVLSNNSDNYELLYFHAGETVDVTLADRTLYKDGDWNTLVLPFDVTLSGSVLSGAKARTLTAASISGSTLNLTFGNEVTKLIAGTPYLIRWESGEDIVNPTFPDVTIDPTDRSFTNGESGDAYVGFWGFYYGIDFTYEPMDGVLLLGANNTLRYAESGAKIGAQRAFFKVGDIDMHFARTITSVNFDFGDDTTGISLLENEERGEGAAWISLDGRRIVNGKPTAKGLYINNGKKVVIK